MVKFLLAPLLTTRMSKGGRHQAPKDVDNETAEGALPDLLLKTTQYALPDIYNLDESGFHYSMPPIRTIVRNKPKERK